MTRGTFVFLATFALAGPTQAGDWPFANKGLKIYPKSEAHYIKQFSGPTVSPCGPCFGYYRTQWRTWGEACNEPQPVDAGPTKYTPPPEDAIPEPEKKGTPAVPKIDAGPKPADKKDPPVLQPDKQNPSLPMPEKKDPPKIDPPVPPKVNLPTPPQPQQVDPPKLNASVVLPLPEIVIPATPPAVAPVQSVSPAPLPVPAVAPGLLPTVIVPITPR